ncbi:MAG: hypothetical protein ACOC0P_03180, partial [Planctomycetota bacterium]
MRCPTNLCVSIAIAAIAAIVVTFVPQIAAQEIRTERLKIVAEDDANGVAVLETDLPTHRLSPAPRSGAR